MSIIEDIFSKYDKDTINILDKENINKIVNFLKIENCNFIDDIVIDYLDLFTFDYDEFVNKYKNLNEKYDNQFLEKVSSDMNILEEFYTI